MLRALFVAAALAAVSAAARAADLPAGNWLLSNITVTYDPCIYIFAVETRDGKPTATIKFTPETAAVTVAKFEVTDTEVRVTLKRTHTVQDQQAFSQVVFVGVRGKDPEVILGSTVIGQVRTRAKLIATDKNVLTADELIPFIYPPEPMQKARRLASRADTLEFQARYEPDAQKRQAILKEAAAAREEADEKTPALYREVVEKHAGSPAAFDAAMSLLRAGEKAKLIPDEAAKLVAFVEKEATPYGEPFVVSQMVPALTAHQAALTRAGRADEAKAVGTRLAVMRLRAARFEVEGAAGGR
jgi:hypothetical protein